MFAEFLREQMMPIKQPITKETADKWNHLQGVILTGGKIKLKWKKILKIKQKK